MIRLSDITDIQISATDIFQRSLLVEEGDFGRIDFTRNQPISSYETYLQSLPVNEIVILEDELSDEPDFIIGTLIFANSSVASVRFFTGAGNWLEDPSEIEIQRITSCQTRTNYINHYARHFSRSNGGS